MNSIVARRVFQLIRSKVRLKSNTANSVNLIETEPNQGIWPLNIMKLKIFKPIFISINCRGEPS